MGNIVTGLDYILNCPVTVKIRTGLIDSKPVAEKLIAKFIDWNVQAVTLHGRSQQQRYSRLANWEYIDQCAQTAQDKIAFFGNGDILSPCQYHEKLNSITNMDGIMIGRGALQKPYI